MIQIMTAYGGKIKIAEPGFLRCLVRKKLIQLTPEEVVRQACLYYLLHDEAFKDWQIEVEYPLSRFRNGAYGFADIVVFKQSVPMLLVELKASEVVVTEAIFDFQARSYAESLHVPLVWISNGYDNLFYQREKGKYHKLKPPSKLRDLWQVGAELSPRLQELAPLSYEELWDEDIQKDYLRNREGYLFTEWLGAKLPKALRPAVLRLGELVYIDKMLRPGTSLGSYRLQEDLGLQSRSSSNPSGQRLTDFYRTLVLHSDASGSFGFSFTLSDYEGINYLRFMLPDVSAKRDFLELRLPDQLKIHHKKTVTLSHSGRINTPQHDYPVNFRSFMQKRGWSWRSEDKAFQLADFSLAQALDSDNPDSAKLLGALVAYVLDVWTYKEICAEHKLPSTKSRFRQEWPALEKAARADFEAGEMEAVEQRLEEYAQRDYLSKADRRKVYGVLSNLHLKWGYEKAFSDYYELCLSLSAKRHQLILKEDYLHLLSEVFENYTKVENKARELLEEYPENYVAHLFLGIALMHLYREEEALPHLEFCLKRQELALSLYLLVQFCQSRNASDSLRVKSIAQLVHDYDFSAIVVKDFLLWLDDFYYRPLQSREAQVQFMNLLQVLKEKLYDYSAVQLSIGFSEFVYEDYDRCLATMQDLAQRGEMLDYVHINRLSIFCLRGEWANFEQELSEAKPYEHPNNNWWVMLLRYFRSLADPMTEPQDAGSLLRKAQAAEEAYDRYLLTLLYYYATANIVAFKKILPKGLEVDISHRALQFDLRWIDRVLKRGDQQWLKIKTLFQGK